MKGVAIRSGHHCTQPLHRLFNASGSARVSLYFYNTYEEIEQFVMALKETIDFFTNMMG
jgi:cysteine desulfurase/selenocysteine lyase